MFEREGKFERVQVKHAQPRDGALMVNCGSQSLTNGRVRATKRYTSDTIDWLVAFNPESGRCYYVPADELGDGRRMITLRLAPARNNQRALTRPACDYESPTPRGPLP